MRMLTRTLTALLVLATASAVSAGGRPYSETIPAGRDGTVSIELISGSVQFIGWARDEIQIEGTLEEDVDGLEISQSKSFVSIEVDLVRKSGGMKHADADLVIHVPMDSRIDAESVSADFEIEGIRGGVSVESVNGRVEIVGDVAEAEVSTVSSHIKVRSDGVLRDGSFESVSGKIEFDGALDPSGRFDFEAVSGSIVLRLPSNTSAKFRVETFSGDIENELGPSAERTSEYVPSKSLQFSMGGGGARVSAESFSGTVRILSQ